MKTLEVGTKDFTQYSVYGFSNQGDRTKADTAVASSTFSSILPENVEKQQQNEKPASDIRYQKADGSEMTNEEKQQLLQLQQRDQEVRAHEQAHMSAGGQYTTPANFSYETGPDGQQYAVGGEVGIDVSEIPDNPEATIVKMRIVERAALAPRDPSGQDYAVASQARAKEANAFSEVQQQTVEKYQNTTRTSEFTPTIDLIA